MYIGRFAPSPTGPLHFGNLVAAVASYCEAKSNNGKWLVRMEDLDKPREIHGAASLILSALQAYGFEWDDDVVYQSERTKLYENALATLRDKNVVYACTCSRKEIADSATTTGIEGAIYPRTCFPKTNLKTSGLQGNSHAASRAMVLDENIMFYDAIQSEVTQNLARDIGDFILKRKDGLFAYQLAVVVDDAAQGITHIVRGADLLDSTPRQIYLQQLLNFPTPAYAHVPIATNLAGEKLSKQTRAVPISISLAGHQLYKALEFLGQNPPAELINATQKEIWRWTFAHWSLAKIPHQRAITFED